MKCQNCGSDEGVIPLTKVEQKTASVVYLCQKCATEKGLEPVPPPSTALTALLGQLGEKLPASGTELMGSCSFCGLELSDFKETGRFGCPHCYASFETGLRNLLTRIHGSSRHVGKVYLPADPTASERELRLDGLRKKLSRAVEVEDFERAAQIRDQIRALETS